MKKYLKLITANLTIAVIAVVLYSPGLVNLRLSDYSIFRAGMSIIAAFLLILAFFLINIRLLKEPDRRPVTLEDVRDLDKAKDILKSHCEGRYFGNLARTAADQLDRIFQGRQGLFTKGVMQFFVHGKP